MAPQGGINSSGDRSWESPLDFHQYTDLTGLVAFEDQSLEPGELIDPAILWTDVDKFDFNLMPDNHMLVCVLAMLSDMNLISAHPLE